MLVVLLVAATLVDGGDVARFASHRADVATLRFVHVVWRHGDRTPTEVVADDDGGGRWPQGLGELTTKGVGQQYRLGGWLRKRYEGFVSNNYNSAEVHVRSSDYNRTLMSAMANMAGFYQGTAAATEFKFQPIPVHTVPREEDRQLHQEIKCPKAERELDAVWASEDAKAIHRRFEELLAFFAVRVRLKSVKLNELWLLYDNYFCEKENNVTWPVWLDASLFQQLTEVYNLASHFEYRTTTLKRLRAGTLLQEIIARSDEHRKGRLGGLKYFAYSAHDATLAALLSTLELIQDVFPLYATAVMFEVHEVGGDSALRIFHKNATDVDDVFEYDIPNCPQPCRLEDLQRTMKKYIPDDWDYECGLWSPSFDNTACMVTIVLLGISTMTFAFLWTRERLKRGVRLSVTEKDGDLEMLLDEEDEL